MTPAVAKLIAFLEANPTTDTKDEGVFRDRLIEAVKAEGHNPMTEFAVTKIWHEVHVPAGTNIIRAAEKMGEMANNSRLNLVADLNGIIFRVEPGNVPELEGKKVADALAERR